MNHLLATLLYVNGHLKPLAKGVKTLPIGPEPRFTCRPEKSLARRVTILPPAALTAGDAARLANQDTLTLRRWLAGIVVILAGIAVVCVLGRQQVKHARERIAWSRQLQDRELAIQCLTREHRRLDGILAARVTEGWRPEVLQTVMAAPTAKPMNPRL